MKANVSRAALTGAIMLGGVHVLWSLFVLLGFAQTLINFSMWAHMIEPGITIAPFYAQAAMTLIVVATAIGYGVGYAMATVWDKVRKA